MDSVSLQFCRETEAMCWFPELYLYLYRLYDSTERLNGFNVLTQSSPEVALCAPQVVFCA